MRASLIAIAGAAALLASASMSEAATVMTLAGAESTSAFVPAPCRSVTACAVPPAWPRTWIATERRLSAACLTHLRDGTVLLCQGSELLRLDRDGRMRHWGAAELGLGRLRDAEAAPDGTVVALGSRGLVRVGADGAVITHFTMPGGWTARSAVAAMADGSAWMTASRAGRPVQARAGVLRVDVEGRFSVIRDALPLSEEPRNTGDAFVDLTGIEARSALVAISGERRVFELDSGGLVRVIRRNPRAGLATVTTLAAGRRGALLVASERGLNMLIGAGRVRTIARGLNNEYDPVEPSAITIDGRRSTRATLTRVQRLDVLTTGAILALVAGADNDNRVIAIAPVHRQPRLAVALPATNRVTLRRGELDVTATRPSRAVITIGHDGRASVRLHAVLRTGHNEFRVRVPAGPDTLTAHVAARGQDGAIATHRLAFVPVYVLSARHMHAVRRLVQEWGSLAVNALEISGCVRSDARTFRCRWEDWGEGTLLDRGTATFTLGWDGLVRARTSAAGSAHGSSLFFEPRNA